ncbi:DUF885 domain-containing protein [Sphingomonas sp. ASV193]|uniref:DUF885 domain-containing protein n=1 Tax=Sphingomonas sp. ASV193 TaxID=3144405 RepID=UPI0032E92A80
MRRSLFIAALLCAAIAAPATALAGPPQDFQKLEADYWANWLRNNPVQASYLGVDSYSDQLNDASRAGARRQVGEAKAFLARLDAIDRQRLSPADQANYDILRFTLVAAVEGGDFGSNYIDYSAGGTLFDNLADYLTNLPLHGEADYRAYLSRLAKVGPALRTADAEAVAVAKRGWARPCSTLGPLDMAMAKVPDADPARSAYYEPFAKPGPAGIAPAAWAAMQAQARATIAGSVNPAILASEADYRSVFKPLCLKSDSMSALPDGKANYAFLVRYHTTTDRTPDEIHALGLSEVARIRAEMDALALKSGFPNRQAMIADMKTNPAYFAKTPDELMAAASRMAKILDGKMPTLFGKLPRLPYGVREIPAATAPGQTTAYYNPGSPAAGIAGTYYVNTSKLDQRPLWELPALTSHEAVPGHHHQIALQQEMDVPAWRQNLSGFTAFVEGWGLYSERLGLDTGIYDTPQKDMGRLSYEMWRACRLVVDTGIHAMGWTKAQAVAFMKENSALTDANIDAEVNRYISTPGQALAYKIGELKFREMRALAERTLGARFDLKAFHDALLSDGPEPVDVVDRRMRAWIAAQPR